MTFEIRLATAADVGAIVDVQRETWAATYTQWVPNVMDDFNLDRSTANWSGWVAATNNHLVVAAEKGVVVGFAGSGPTDADGPEGAGQVYAIYVRPDRHGKGIGKALMADAFGWLAERGHPECVLWVAEPSTRSRGFYERQGLALDEGVSQPWRTITIVRYRRPLP
jgi:GNAT superfamily N-acetyltransferase